MELTDDSSRDGRPIVLSTPRLTVTAWEDADLGDFYRLHADPLTMRFFVGGPYTRERARERLGDFLREQAGRGWTKWRVQDHEGRTVGRGGFGLTDEGTHRELGYLLAPECWGRGLATELAHALVEWHFAHPDPGLSPDLIAFAHVENTASRRVLEKLGFVQTGEREWRGLPHAFSRLAAREWR
ncbi:GNAT family N-acetyltransferase [Deinococcus aetherius]|uniref:GNAT family N-acetyltransferase n=1 Tax=Deinococcus aetherius TaxID=200252 RepID=UPI0022305C64|nr:GNAT family N-acetyltransferase [Deinococcus aetherius]